MATLFEIGADMLALHELLTDIGGDVSDEAVEAAIMAWLAENETNDAVKADSYVNLIRKLESEADLASQEAQAYQLRAKVRNNRVASLKRRLLEHMIATGRTKLVTATGRTIAIQSNGRVPLQIDDTVDYKNVDPKFVRYECKIDSDAVREHLDNGGTLPFARFGEKGSHIRIK